MGDRDAPLASASSLRHFNASQSSSLLPGYGVPVSIYPADSVKDAAEAIGVNNLKEHVALALASDVECRIRELVQDAAKYMRHARREQLRVTDIDLALRAKNIEPLYGFLPAMSGKASPSVASHPSAAGPSFRRVQTPGGILHYLEDEEVDFDRVLQAGPALKAGKGVGWTAHWLAIEGVQPAIPQNPNPTRKRADAHADGLQTQVSVAPVPRSLTGGATAPVPGGAAKPGQAKVKPLIKHVLSRELQLYYERLTAAILSPPETADEDAEAETTGEARLDTDGDVSMSGAGAASVAQVNGNSRDSLRSGNAVRTAALASLRGDAGLHQLVPYLVQWIAESVTNHLRDAHVLGLMLLVAQAICENQTIFIEPYLHQLLPSVLSVLLTSTLANASPTTPKQNVPSALALRRHAASLLAHIVADYAAAYPSLKQRVVRTLLKALDAGCGKGEAETGTETGARGTASAADAAPQPPRRERTREGSGASDGSAQAPSGTAAGAAAGTTTPTMTTAAPGEATRPRPRESPGTKLGALLGLRHIGAGSVRLLLVRPQANEARTGHVDATATGAADTGGDGAQPAPSYLERLGEWCERWSRSHGPEQLRAIEEEVQIALRLLARHEAGATEPFAAPSSSNDHEDGDGRGALASRCGEYWATRLAGDDEVRRLLLLRNVAD